MDKKARSKVQQVAQTGANRYSSSISSCGVLTSAPRGVECAPVGVFVPVARGAAKRAPAGSRAVVGRADALQGAEYDRAAHRQPHLSFFLLSCCKDGDACWLIRE